MRVRWLTVAACLLAVASVAVLYAHGGRPASADTLEPEATVGVIDGDTLQIGGKVVDVYGIDAPELGQICLHDGTPWTCGQDAAYALKKLVDLNPVTCEPRDQEAGAGHACKVGNGDIATTMLRGGYAVAKPGDLAVYAEAEGFAKEAKIGLWRGRFVPPWRWRTGERLSEESAETPADCPIKTMIGAGGQKLYYVPTDADYDAITPDPTLGETAFCSDETAREAGWKRPGESDATAAPG